MLIIRDVQCSGQGHAVLAASLNQILYILDNLSRPSYLIMDDTVFIKRYIPMLALNEEGMWFFPAARTTPLLRVGQSPKILRRPPPFILYS